MKAFSLPSDTIGFGYRGIILAIGLLAMAAPVHGQNIVMKDGKTIVNKGLRRQGDNIMATVELQPAEGTQPARTGELGYPVSQVARIDFPEPGVLRTAPDLIAQGNATEALARLEPAIKFYEPFRDVPGNWWVDSALIKAQALGALGREAEAEPLAQQVLKTATDPEAVRAAELQLAASMVRKGAMEKAKEVAERAIKESKRPSTRAAAFIVRGQTLLARKEWEDALLAFLNVPVFYPGERVLVPQALLGAGRAHFGMDDLPRAKTILQEVLATYANAPEAKLARAELDLIARREKALAPPK